MAKRKLNEGSWADFFKLFTYAFADDPHSKRNSDDDIDGAGVLNPEAIPDIRGDGSFWGGNKGYIRLHDSNDFVDISSATSRVARMKEYQRLRTIPEIENVMTVFADEACVAGDTPVATPAYGEVTIQWLAENKTDERFLVYAWDFEKEDFTYGWAYNPRKTGTRKTIKVTLDDGSSYIVTPDHRFLMRDQSWKMGGELEFGDNLMAFYRIQPNQNLNTLKTGQFPRIFTHNEGWTHERFFVEMWKGIEANPSRDKVQRAIRAMSNGLSVRQVAELLGNEWKTIESHLKKAGFTTKEVKWLSRKSDTRKVVGVQPWDEIDVYDLSVEKHMCFASKSIVFHNCQTGENNHVCEVICEDHEVKKEAEWLLFNQLDIDSPHNCWNDFKNLCISGDHFWENVIHPEKPDEGILKLVSLPAESMFRIETTKGRLVEFQQSPEGPDHNALQKGPAEDQSTADLKQSTALRFNPNQIVHIRINEDRKTFYPYGVSMIEPARTPAHQLRMMEDAMLVYRLSRAPERRIFYIDMGTVAPFRAEAFMERMKDQLKKKKGANTNSARAGASGVEERWHAPAVDEDYWIPLRPNSQTRIESLPGAQNLGEIDDALYFRNKLYTALNFPQNYFNNPDPNSTRVTLSAQNVTFAKLIERLQTSMARAYKEVIFRHLKLRGFPEESFEDLKVKMTPPSEWRELSRAEVVTNRINNAGSLKGSQMMSDFDILTKWMKYSDDDALEMMARNKLQKYEELKMQIIAQNPQLLGVGLPGEDETEIGVDGTGPNPNLMPPDMMGSQPGMPGMPPEGSPEGPAQPEGGGAGMSPEGGPDESGQQPPGRKGTFLPEPTDEEIAKYDLGIQDYGSEMDAEDIDYSGN